MSRTRYTNLYRLVAVHKPQSILEIGTYDGNNAVNMLKIAPKDCIYYGFDLFEDITQKLIEKENSKKKVATLEQAKKTLSPFKYRLYRGFTKDTLPLFQEKVDFVFIDGGHSEETILSDWQSIQKNLRKETVVVFDDYYSGKKPGFGCDTLLDALDSNQYQKTLLSPNDMTTSNYPVSMVKVEQLFLPQLV